MKNKSDTKKSITEVKKIFLLLIIMLSIIIISAEVKAGLFDVVTTICSENWYCTNYTSGTCGTRTCLDSGVCGTTKYKPAEITLCPPPPSTGGSSGGGSSGGGGSGGESGVDSTTDKYYFYPPGYFVTSSDIIKVEIAEQEEYEKNIIITSMYNETYNFSVEYPEGYTQKRDFVTPVLIDPQILENEYKKLGLRINSSNISPGTYMVSIMVFNGHYFKKISTIITVGSKKGKSNNIDFSMAVDSKVKYLGRDNNITITINLMNINSSTINTTYSLINSEGKNVFTIRETNFVTENNNIKKELAIPKDLAEGYYMIITTISSGNTTRTKNVLITILSQDKYLPVNERPSIIQNFSKENKITGIIIIIVIVLLIINMFFYLKIKIFIKQTAEYIAIKYKNKLNQIKNRKIKNKTINNKNTILKKSYEQGFITLEEYKIFTGEENVSTNKPVEKIITPKIAAETVTTTETTKFEPKEKSETVENKDQTKPQEEPTSNIEKDVQSEYKRKIFNTIINGEKTFFLKNGEELHTIKDLIKHLEKIDIDSFNHHTMQGRNDFANWVEGAFEDKELAKVIKESNSISSLKKNIEEYFATVTDK